MSPEEVPFNYPEPPHEGEAKHFAISENGEPRCVIVRSAKASRSALRAATGFRRYLQLATGARIRLIEEGTAVPERMGAIHVGDTSVGLKTKLSLPEVRYGQDVLPNLNGYLVKTVDPRTLVIRGSTEMATSHGLVGFLQRYVGVRQYWPGSPGGIGDVVPSRPTLYVPEVEWRDWPYFFSRHFSMYGFTSRGVLDFFRRNRTLACNENYSAWLPPEKYGTTNPEFFPFVSGKRRVPKTRLHSGWQPCVSNPAVRRIMAEAVAEHFRKSPDAIGVNFAVNDGNGDCMCEGCRAMDAPGTDYSRRTGMSDRYVKLTNQVCETVWREYPSKIIVYLAYSAARPAPKTVELHPAIMPMLTTPGNFFAACDEWMRAGAQRMGLYAHHDDDFMFVLPKLDFRQAARRIRYAVASGRARIFYMEMFPHWPISGIVPYVVAELLWDPRRDVDAVLSEYSRTFFGPAAVLMQAFYGTLESGYERWLQNEGVPHWFAKDVSATKHSRAPEQFRVLTLDEAQRAAECLERAVEAARGDARVADRVGMVKLMFRLQELAVQHYWTTVRMEGAQVRSEEDARRVVDDAHRLLTLVRAMRDYRRNVLEQSPASEYRLFQRPKGTAQNVLYEKITSGEPTPEARTAISVALNAATEHLRGSLGPEKAASWWRALREAEQEPLLAAAFEVAEIRAKGVELQNLVADPSFEELGQEIGPDEFAVQQDLVLDRAQEKRVGLHLWFAERSPYRCVLSRREAHTGRHSVMLEHCHRGRFSRYVKPEPGARYRVGLWLKRDAAAGRYTVTVGARPPGTAKEAILASIRVADTSEGWQEIAADVTVLPDTRLLILRLFVNGQVQGAKCWIDDLFIGQYPQ